MAKSPRKHHTPWCSSTPRFIRHSKRLSSALTKRSSCHAVPLRPMMACFSDMAGVCFFGVGTHFGVVLTGCLKDFSFLGLFEMDAQRRTTHFGLARPVSGLCLNESMAKVPSIHVVPPPGAWCGGFHLPAPRASWRSEQVQSPNLSEDRAACSRRQGTKQTPIAGISMHTGISRYFYGLKVQISGFSRSPRSTASGDPQLRDQPKDPPLGADFVGLAQAN